MSHLEEDSFNDEELSQMAAEIMHDLQNNQSDPFGFSFQTDSDVSDTTLQLPSSNDSSNMIYINYPSQSPFIVSDKVPLSNRTSLLPTVPSSPKQRRTALKSGINGWCTQPQTSQTHSPNKLPYINIPPPSAYVSSVSDTDGSIPSNQSDIKHETIENDTYVSIESHLSPRVCTPRGTQSQIPDFSDLSETDSFPNTQISTRVLKVVHKSRKKRKRIMKRAVSPLSTGQYKHSLRRVVSPISINIKSRHTKKPNRKRRSRASTYTADMNNEYAVERNGMIFFKIKV